jgi:hypothetical protein
MLTKIFFEITEKMRSKDIGIMTKVVEKGFKILNQIGKDADESKMIVDVLCKRLIRGKFDAGIIPGRISGKEELITMLSGANVCDILKDIELEDICQHVHSWQDQIETCSKTYDGSSPLLMILQQVTKFPTVEKAKSLLGEEMSDMYVEALEKIEKRPDVYSEFPDERSNGGWSKQSAERAVSLVVDVIAPYGSDPNGMLVAYTKYMEEYRSQQREKRITHNVDGDARKVAARNLGIWFPVSADLQKWETDPRTRDRAADFQRLVIRTMEKMRIMRSVLQYIPRRRFSNHTIDDMDANMARMEAYVKDGENRKDVKNLKRERSEEGEGEGEDEEVKVNDHATEPPKKISKK